MPDPRTVITIGNFDGVHVGHAALVRRAVELARPIDARVLVMAFDPHPMTRLKPEASPTRLTTFEHRSELLRASGADDVIKLEPRDELLGLAPEQFVRTLLLPHRPAWVVEGSDFHFGKGRAGNVRVLAELAAAMGFGADVVAPVEVGLTDHQIVTASSTIARWLITHGRVRDAAVVLGRPYQIRGKVIKGDQRGRTIGFPTANLDTEQLLPATGVYGAIARLEDGREFTAAINVGTRPTFNGHGRRLEAHFLDVRAGELSEYGWPVAIDVIGFARDDVKFDSVARLTDQIGRDCRAVRTMINDARAHAASGHVRAGAGINA